jgi:phospholipid/cholesterol/gamma-HCH transport system substrate-binding protein
VWTQLAILASVTIISIAVMAFGFVKVPALLGIGRYTVTVDLPASGGLYPTSVVNYRGTESRQRQIGRRHPKRGSAPFFR